MSLGYDVDDKERDFDKKGITDKVSRFSTSQMEFPNIVIYNTQEHPLKAHKVRVLKSMMTISEQALMNLPPASASDVTLYVTDGSQVIRIGKVRASQVMPVLRLFDEEKLLGYMDAETLLEGIFLYTLCE